MWNLQIVAALALLTAIGHSYLSERLFLGPLRAEPAASDLAHGDVARRLTAGFFHLASVMWVGMAFSLLVLEPGVAGYRSTLYVYAAIYALSGLLNLWALRRPHPGGFFMLAAAALTLLSA